VLDSHTTRRTCPQAEPRRIAARTLALQQADPSPTQRTTPGKPRCSYSPTHRHPGRMGSWAWPVRVQLQSPGPSRAHGETQRRYLDQQPKRDPSSAYRDVTLAGPTSLLISRERRCGDRRPQGSVGAAAYVGASCEATVRTESRRSAATAAEPPAAKACWAGSEVGRSGYTYTVQLVPEKIRGSAARSIWKTASSQENRIASWRGSSTASARQGSSASSSC
jgi:hypothetical protein